MDPTVGLPRGAQSKAATAAAAAAAKEDVVYSVNEVYVHIPAELSAAGYELKIRGSVKIIDKRDEYFLKWSPTDLTQQDVASLYSCQTDSWTMVDDVVEPPEVIDMQELEYPNKNYSGANLALPDSILPPPSSPSNDPEVAVSPDKQKMDGVSAVKLESKGAVTYRRRDIVKDVTVEFTGKSDAVDFSLGDLKCIKAGKEDKRYLTFFLKSGQELPALHFHDGGTAGLLQALRRYRYVYLERDRQLPSFYYCKEYDKSKRPQSVSKEKKEVSDSEPPQFKQITPQNHKGAKAASEVHELIQGVVGNFVGITRAVRQHLLPEKQLLEVRPGTENDDDDDEPIQTCVMSDVGPGSTPSPTSPTTATHKDPAKTRQSSTGNGGVKGASKRKNSADPEESLITDFQLITDIRGKLPPRPEVAPRQPPVTGDEWERLRDDGGRILESQEQHLRARVFAGGISDSLRKEAWKYLLNYYPFRMSDIERMELRESKEKEYWVMKQQWQAFTPKQEENFRKWREVKHLINKDVLRTDRDNPTFHSVGSPKLQQLEDILRTYAMYNFDLGYVQGMSDLLAPLLVVMDNEVDAFWCFVGYMDMVEHHFEMSQEGMRNRLKQLRALLNIIDPELYQFLKMKESNNLYFCFRWLIVHFKREFHYEDIMSLWEVFWTEFLSPDFPLFVALAILSKERESFINQSFDFSDILQHVNGLSHGMNLPPILELAESLCYQLGSSPHLPDDLETLIVRPLPSRVALSAIPQATDDTIICSPDSRAVPTTLSS